MNSIQNSIKYFKNEVFFSLKGASENAFNRVADLCGQYVFGH